MEKSKKKNFGEKRKYRQREKLTNKSNHRVYVSNLENMFSGDKKKKKKGTRDEKLAKKNQFSINYTLF